MSAAKSSFPEMMYSFAATHELTRLSPWWSSTVPIFPSLRRERRGGYDVRMDLPGTLLLLQYKLSSRVDHLRFPRIKRGTRALIGELRGRCSAGLHQFWTTDHQHRLLRRIANRFPYAYYAAPRFADLATLNDHFANRGIFANSMLVRVLDFPDVTRGVSARHRIIAPVLDDRNYIFTKPKSVPQIGLRAELVRVWEDWDPYFPMAMQLENIWSDLPRLGKVRALAFARRELQAPQQFPVRSFGITPRSAERRLALPAAPTDEDAFVRRRRPRRPPWHPSTFRLLDDTSPVLPSDEDLVRLVALSYAFNSIGVTMSILQPSETALKNSRFYSEEGE